MNRHEEAEMQAAQAAHVKARMADAQCSTQGISPVNECGPALGAASADRQSFGLPWQRPTEEITLNNADAAMAYQGWDEAQREAGEIVRESLTLALKSILRHVPRSPRRTLAVQHLISARMDANAAISFRGRF